jgi:TorA maturation chaperone TorD
MAIQFGERKEIAEARAGVYRFLAQLYGRPPTAELLSTLAESDFQQHLGTVFREAAQPLLDAVAAGLDLEALQLEYDALFRVPGDRYLRPYESVYRGRRMVDGRVVDGAVWGPWTEQVQHLYAQAGAELAREAGELPDFIGAELEFMVFLCEREAEAWAAGEAEQAQKFAVLQRRFLIEHLSRWVDALCDEMRAMASSDFYRSLAEMTRAFIASDLAQV